MAAMRTGVTPACLARLFLRHAGNSSPRNRSPPETWNQRMLQRCHLHTVVVCRSPAARALLCRRQNGNFLLVNAVTVRHNSSQIPGEMISEDVPLAGASFLDLTSVPADPAPFAAQSIIEQMPVERVSEVAEASISTSILDSSFVPVAADSAPVVSQLITELTEAPPTAVEVLQGAFAEQTLEELGLAAHTPVGLIQNMLECMHIDLGLPWWGAIVAGTLLVRLALFPVIVKGHREAAKMNNVMPEFTKLTTKLTEAKRNGNLFEYAKAYADVDILKKLHDVNPLRGFIIPLVQTPVFISFFIALRKMAYLPVPSLQTGGALWFPDLTAADPFYLLPLAVTGTMFFILELGAESGVDNPNLRVMKTLFRIMPFFILPITINFPTAVFIYWLMSNSFTLGQLALLRHPWVREKLNIPKRIIHPPSVQPESEGLFASMRKGWSNVQLGQQLEERERRIKSHLDLAAKGPLRQTFTHNPLQQTAAPSNDKSTSQAASSKARPWKETIG